MSRLPDRGKDDCGGTLIILPLPGIGDLIWHVSHIHRIARAAPQRRVTILTKPRSMADRLLAADPGVAEVLWLERAPGKHDGLCGFLRLVRMLRRHRFSQAWVLHQSPRYAIAAMLAGIPRRLGYGRGLQRWFLNCPPYLPKYDLGGHPINMADRLLALHGLSERDGDDCLPISSTAAGEVAKRFGERPKPWIALGVGSSEPYKQWGAKRFSELVTVLTKPHSCTLFLVGGPAEAEMARTIMQSAGSDGVVAATDLAIDLTAALLAQCAFYVGNDTGALNLAAAVGVPAVGLFGGSQPLRHSPRIHAVQAASPDLGMSAIDVVMVMSMVNELKLLDQ